LLADNFGKKDHNKIEEERKRVLWGVGLSAADFQFLFMINSRSESPIPIKACVFLK
jgi:hypothetical protein